MESEKIAGAAGGRKITGHISQIIGPVVDVAFEGPENEIVLPSIHDAMDIRRDDGRTLIVEVQQHIGENTVRTVAMDSTDGLRRGMEAVSYFRSITMPVGEQIKGRLMNVVGEAIDGMKPLDGKGAYPIHREPPKFDELTTVQEVLYTGIKVIDLLEPYSKGGKIGLFGGAGERRRTCLKRFFSHGKRAEKHVQAASEPRCIAAGGRFRQEGVQLLFRPRPRHIKQVQRFTGVVRNGLVVLSLIHI